MSADEEKENDGHADFDAMLVRLRGVSEVLEECGKTCNEHGAGVLAGMIAATLVIVEELVAWMEDMKTSSSSEEEPS